MEKKQDGFKPEDEKHVMEQTPEEILQLAIEDTANKLAAEKGVPVHAFVFYDSKDTDKKDPVIGYMFEPDLMTKIRVLDKSSTLGDFAGSHEMLQLCLIKEASDKRIYSTQRIHDKYVLGACLEAQKMIQIALSQFKKK